MENKKVGWLLIGIAVFIGAMLFFFSHTARNVLDNSCPIIASGHQCPAYAALDNQMYFAFAIVGILILVGIFLIFSKSKEKIIVKQVERKAKEREIDTSELTSEEKHVLQIVQQNKAIFQAELIERTGIGKVKVSRILDRLEGHRLIERKRRGMTNIVVLKNTETSFRKALKY